MNISPWLIEGEKKINKKLDVSCQEVLDRVHRELLSISIYKIESEGNLLYSSEKIHRNSSSSQYLLKSVPKDANSSRIFCGIRLGDAEFTRPLLTSNLHHIPPVIDLRCNCNGKGLNVKYSISTLGQVCYFIGLLFILLMFFGLVGVYEGASMIIYLLLVPFLSVICAVSCFFVILVEITQIEAKIDAGLKGIKIRE